MTVLGTFYHLTYAYIPTFLIDHDNLLYWLDNCVDNIMILCCTLLPPRSGSPPHICRGFHEWTDGKIVLFSTVIIIYWVKERKNFTTRVNTIKTNGTRQPAQRRSHSLDISAFVTVVMCLRFCKLRMRDVDQFMDSAHVMYVTSTEVDGSLFSSFF